MKKCELCKSAARMYCDSDQASLCWDCDSRVHSANFIVSKHVRTLLCHVCQSPTPWTGSGFKLAPTVSVCETCCKRRSRGNRINLGSDRSDDDGDGGNVCHDSDDDGDIQVVPLCPPPPASAANALKYGESTNPSPQDYRFSGP